MAAIHNSSGDPTIEPLISKHPGSVNWAISFNTLHNMVKKVHGDDLSVRYNEHVYAHVYGSLIEEVVINRPVLSPKEAGACIRSHNSLTG